MRIHHSVLEKGGETLKVEPGDMLVVAERSTYSVFRVGDTLVVSRSGIRSDRTGDKNWNNSSISARLERLNDEPNINDYL